MVQRGSAAARSGGARRSGERLLDLAQVLLHDRIALRDRLCLPQIRAGLLELALLEVRATAGAPRDRALAIDLEHPLAVLDRVVVGLALQLQDGEVRAHGAEVRAVLEGALEGVLR